MKEQPKSVKKALEEIRELEFRIFKMAKAAKLAEEIVAEHQDEIPRMEVSLGYQSGSLKGVLIMAHEVQDMRDVLPIIRDLRRHGFKVERYEDYPPAKRRVYDMGEIYVCAFLPWDDGAACKFVKVGMKEEPKYELQCEGEAFEEEVVLEKEG